MNRIVLLVFLVLFVSVIWFIFMFSDYGDATNPVSLDVNERKVENKDYSYLKNDIQNDSVSTRIISVAENVVLPLTGSAPTANVKFSIPVEEIRRGCSRQDCIPSVDNPVFVSISEVDKILDDQSIGLSLSYKGINRFYSFNMLVTREIVNDIVAGDPLLITYCPLCGTGIVFERLVDGDVQEFGVSGMLWQSNLLMYNRAEKLEDRNIWSQSLGEAVVGSLTGSQLTMVPSDIMRYGDWKNSYPNGEVLNTGSTRDPYNGQYYEIARNFRPNFNEVKTPIDPSTYVYGIAVNGTFKAYPRDLLPVGVTNDIVNEVPVILTKQENGNVNITTSDGDIIDDVEGFWFSWVSIHPDTSLWGS